MNQDTLEHLYVIGNYSLLLEEINILAYNHPSTKLDDIEQSICVSYHSRALIRLGKVNEAEILIQKIANINLNKEFSISSLIYQTSSINLQITQGNITEALKNGTNTETLVEQKGPELSEQPKILSFWGAFLYYLIGIAYFHQYKNELARKYFQKSLGVNQTNIFIKAKCLYYMGVIERGKGNFAKFNELFEESLEIFQSIEATQGSAWIITWQGQNFLQQGDIDAAKSKLFQALELFESINGIQGLNIVNSLIGLMFFQQGELKQAEEILKEVFDSFIEIGNPTMLSYCLIPLIVLYIESGTRSRAQKCLHEFQELSKDSSSESVKIHGLIAEAILLKSSSRIQDKAQAQSKFLELLNTQDEGMPLHSSFQISPASAKNFSFLVISHLAELYLEEFKLSEDTKILLEAQQLIDNHIEHKNDQKFSPEVVELSLLKAKLSIVEGDIEKALVTLEQTKQDANVNNFFFLEKKVNLEIAQIEREFKKWDAAISVRERIEKVQIEEYLKEAQQMSRMMSKSPLRSND